eukprot:3259147-Amphidinium_carterae.1
MQPLYARQHSTSHKEMNTAKPTQKEVAVLIVKNLPAFLYACRLSKRALNSQPLRHHQIPHDVIATRFVS